MKKIILKIKDLNVSIEDKLILKDFNLSIREGETHVIMGPNGSGKSTLSKVLAGHPLYFINKGSIEFDKGNLLKMSPETRAHKGLFLAFQQPIEIAGVTNYDFLRIAYNKKQKILKKAELDPINFMLLLNNLVETLKFKPELLNRGLNDGFSGGEKKRNEILQMLLLEPKLAILDEIDSGLDVDALKIICNSINNNSCKNLSRVIITHYPRILTYLKPTIIHIMVHGKIVQSGGFELADSIEKNGYSSLV